MGGLPRQDFHAYPQLFHNALTAIPEALGAQRFPNQQDTDFFLCRNLCR
jgi:hypothetical protein